MNPPLLLIRADASPKGGTGHIMRTLAIAQEWIALGGNCTYLCCSLPNKLRQRLINERCDIIKLKEATGTEQEAKETSAHVNYLKANWILLDSYLFTSKYHQEIELLENTKVACISDFGSADFHKPDLAIHSNIKTVGDYAKLPTKTKLLAGVDYILIRRELIKNNSSERSDSNTNNLLISIGGSDSTETSFDLCQSIVKSNTAGNYSIRVILGPAYPENGKMHELAIPNVEIVNSPESMAEQYEWADTLICTPSTTAFEAIHHNICLGLITIADNQAELGELLSKLNLALLLADNRDVDSGCNSYNLTSLSDAQKKIVMKIKTSGLIDGQGASRVCKYMLKTI